MNRPKRNIITNSKTYHRYYRLTGFYPFIVANLIKIGVIIVIILLAALLVNSFIIKISEIPEFLVNNLNMPFVLLVFFVSESILGLIPPDIFILWVSDMPHPYLMVGVLAIISYIGGFSAYFVGSLFHKIPKIKIKIEHLYSQHIKQINKWGSIFVVVSALFPIPYAIVCSLLGLMNYPFVRLTYLGIFRILRFYLYAWVIFGIV